MLVCIVAICTLVYASSTLARKYLRRVPGLWGKSTSTSFALDSTPFIQPSTLHLASPAQSTFEHSKQLSKSVNSTTRRSLQETRTGVGPISTSHVSLVTAAVAFLSPRNILALHPIAIATIPHLEHLPQLHLFELSDTLLYPILQDRSAA